MSNFKVGDKVRVKSREHFDTAYRRTNNYHHPNGWVNSMTLLIGTTVTIKDRAGASVCLQGTERTAWFSINDIEPATTIIDPRSLK